MFKRIYGLYDPWYRIYESIMHLWSCFAHWRVDVLKAVKLQLRRLIWLWICLAACKYNISARGTWHVGCTLLWKLNELHLSWKWNELYRITKELLDCCIHTHIYVCIYVCIYVIVLTVYDLTKMPLSLLSNSYVCNFPLPKIVIVSIYVSEIAFALFQINSHSLHLPYLHSSKEYCFCLFAFCPLAFSKAWTRPKQGHVRVGHVSDTDTCPTRVEHVLTVSDTSQQFDSSDTVKPCLRHSETVSWMGCGFIGSVWE